MSKQEVLDKLGSLWVKYPDLRLGQLIMDAVSYNHGLPNGQSIDNYWADIIHNVLWNLSEPEFLKYLEIFEIGMDRRKS